MRTFEVFGRDEGIVLSWSCDPSIDTDSFTFTYQLVNAGMCDTGNATGFPVIDLGFSSSTHSWHYRHTFSKVDDISLLPNSIYLFTVQARQWQPGSGFVYGTRQGVNITTREGGFIDERFIALFVEACRPSAGIFNLVQNLEFFVISASDITLKVTAQNVNWFCFCFCFCFLFRLSFFSWWWVECVCVCLCQTNLVK